MVDVGTAGRGLHIATCPVNWNNNDIPGWRPVTGFPAILSRMRDAGYRATEYDGSFGDDPATLLTEAQSHGLTWTGSYQWVDFLKHGGDLDAYEDLKPTLGVLQAIGCQNLIVADSLRPHRVAMAGRVPANGVESLDEASYRRIAEGVHTLALIAREFGIAVRYHNHVGTWIEAPHEISDFLSYLDTSRANLCFDTGHYAYGGGDPASFIRDHIDRIGYLHLKDVDTAAVADARARKLTFIDALREIVFAPIGTGSADIPAILRVLVDRQFSGWIVVEQDTCAGDPTDTARENRAFIEQWLDDHRPNGR
ncbi:MAG TPA: sugar phosphate isomerase/epimerase [Thermomicrobiales bacterium]|nr:sugar phosphate isomerase/epimerase [Thermomicrobiales bacterium]